MSFGRKNTLPKPIAIGSVTLGASAPVFILGPCVIESPRFLRSTAARIDAIAKETGIQWVLKASYDKANRTSPSSFRGPGLADGCKLLAELGAQYGVPVTTDVHSPEEAEAAAEWIDILQIPAFLCRQTDIITAAASTGRVVNVKKGQFLTPWDVGNIADKIRGAGCHRYFFTERGASFGYGHLVADMRSLYWIRQQGHLIVFDATHSVQRPGGSTTTGGDGELAPVLARAAMASGCDGIFMETHPNPAKAYSDGPNQVPLKALGAVLSQLLRISAALGSEVRA